MSILVQILDRLLHRKRDPEVDPIVWAEVCPSLDGAAGCPGGGPKAKAAIHSGLESALGSHPCVALSSYQAPPSYGNRGSPQKKNHPLWKKTAINPGGFGGQSPPSGLGAWQE